MVRLNPTLFITLTHFTLQDKQIQYSIFSFFWPEVAKGLFNPCRRLSVTITLGDANGSDALHSGGCDTSSSLFTVCFGKGSVDLLLLKSEKKLSFLSEVTSLN